MKRMRNGLWMIFLLCLTIARPAEAIWTDLSPEQIQEAIRWGKAHLEERKAKGLEIDGLEPEWEMDLGEGIGKGKAYLQTPFAMISFESRKYAAIQMEVPTWLIDSIVLQTKGKLLFALTLFGKERYFARKYTVFLESQGKKIEPEWADIHKGVLFESDGSETVLRAAYNVTFPVEEIDPQTQITLVALSPEGTELRFPFDLSKMR